MQTIQTGDIWQGGALPEPLLMMYIHQMGSLNDFLHLVAIHRVAQDDDDCHVAAVEKIQPACLLRVHQLQGFQ